MQRFALALTAGLATLAACSGEDERPPPPPSFGAKSGASGRGASAGAGATGDASAGTAGRGGTAGRDGGDSGSAASGGSSGDGGEGGEDAGPAVCGNGVAEGSEGCDGSDVRMQTCVSYGFESGSLACQDCSLDFRGCVGTENCADGRDNDADQAVDCADSDCTASCQDPCSAPALLPDPASSVVGQTNGHVASTASSCKPAPAASGPETVYRFTAARTGVLDVRLTSTGPDFNLSVRGTCGDAGSELGCSETSAGSDAIERVLAPVTQGQTVFIVVDGTGAASEGRYRLDALSRSVQCGDSNRDTGEECDDGNRMSTDGCGADCRLEPDESEPNGSTGEADAYSGFPFFASIAPAGDVDVFSLTVSSAGSTITAETLDLGDGACAQFQLDSVVEILAPDGSTVLATDNDSGDGFCSVATVTGAAAGTHFVRVRAAAASATFPYKLNAVAR
jgi:cysteine-rich repeat protein